MRVAPTEALTWRRPIAVNRWPSINASTSIGRWKPSDWESRLYSLGVVVVDEVACGSTIAKRGGLHETHAHLAQEVESPPPPQSNRSAPTLPSAAAANLSLNRRLPPLPPPLRAGPFLYPASFPPVHYCASPRRPAHTCAFPASSAPVVPSSPTTAGSPPHRCEEAGRGARWGCSADLPYEL